ncbi:Kinesin-like protein [Phytophthora fragariae]|uniref:Kinesin-like protein n=1 Tax=Phytophthora fragariae TaxID=53985 RepID=A0A6A3TGB8_9STRA|nr:Kinesin-like protein [Phytophthora fragariae]
MYSKGDGDAAQYEDEDDTTSTLNGDEGQPTEEESNIRIFLRVKPSRKPSGFFSWDEDSNMMKYDIPKDVAAGLINNSRTSYKFRFDSVIGMEAKQDEVFDRVGRPCVESALNGFNSTVFAYGQTGSGKTFTITGGAERYEDRGLIPRALSLIFERMRNNNQEQIVAQVSYLEIYNNQGYDLLDPNHASTKSLDDLPRVAMLEDEDGNCHLRNLSMHPVTTEEDALNLLFLGDTNRAVSETAMNLASSRSHCIFTVSLEARKVGSEVVLRSKLHLVDLAGSERAHKTGAKGQLLREAAYINTSLHYLEMVIVALHEKNTKGRTHIPYRNSMMTSVLRDSLGGNCKTVMVATVSPEKDQTDESVSTCRFAQRVARVKNDARLNEEVDPAVIIRQLKARVASLEEELAILKGDVNEGAELKEYEIDKLRQKCLNFVNDSEPSAHLSMGEFTYTKMKACFDILKSMANAAGAAAASGGGATGLSGGVKLISAGTGGNNQEMEQRVHELEQLVQQRDNEIAIMVNMIRKEHGATIPTELLSRGFAESTNNQDEHHAKPQKKQSAAAKPAADYASTFVVDSATLDDPAKAFEAFKAQYPKNDAIRDNKIALKRKYDAAKALASEVNEARNQIKALTLKIEKLRKQQAIADEGLLDAGSEGVDAEASSAVVAKARAETEAADQKLKDQIDGHKVAYKKGFNELSELKKEIQHIQKMLEMGRIKLQKDFDLWYQRQGKGALLTETLLAQAKPEPNRSSNNNTQSSGKLRDPIKSSSPERPETLPQKAAPWEAESRQYNESKRVSSSQSQRSSVARQSTASTVEENVSGFYEALDILKRRNNPRNCRQQRDGQVGERSSER